MRLSSLSLTLLYEGNLVKHKSLIKSGYKQFLLNMQEYTAPVLIFANELSELDLEFWKKVMKACNVSVCAYQFVLLENQIPIFNDSDLKLPKICLLCTLNRVQLQSFGIRTRELYHIQKTHNFSLLSISNTADLRENPEEKRILWAKLKQIFAIP